MATFNFRRICSWPYLREMFENIFDPTSGHTHDGTAGNGGPIGASGIAADAVGPSELGVTAGTALADHALVPGTALTLDALKIAALTIGASAADGALLQAHVIDGTTLLGLQILPKASATHAGINYHRIVMIDAEFGDPAKPTTGLLLTFGRNIATSAGITDTGLDVRISNGEVNVGANQLQGAYIKAKNESGGTVGGNIVGLFIEAIQQGTCAGSTYGLKFGTDGSVITADILFSGGATLATGFLDDTTKYQAMWILPASGAAAGVNYHRGMSLEQDFGDPTKPTTGLLATFSRSAVATGTFTDTGADFRVSNAKVNTTGAYSLQGIYIKAKNTAAGTLTGDLIGLFIEAVNDGTVNGSVYGLKIGKDSGALTADILLSNGATIYNSPAAVLTITEGTIALVGDVTAAAGTVYGSQTITSATPSTTREGRFEITLNPASVVNIGSASGSIVGVRGCVTLNSGKNVTDGYIYGAQGKFVGDGATISVGSGHIAGVLAQMSGSGMTLTDGHVGVLIVSGQNLPASANMNMIYLESGGNSINALIQSNVKCDYVFDLNTFESATCIVAAGVSSGSFGNADGVATKVLKIKIDGATYYIPTHTQNT